MSRSNGAVPRVGPVQLPEINDRVARIRAQAFGQIGRVGEGVGSRSAALLSDARRAARGRADAAMVRLQLANTSRELAHETTDLGEAVESLNAIVKSNRKVAGAAKRRRLFAGIAVGAALAYHLDVENGKQRRAATARLLSNAARGGVSKARAAIEARGAVSA